MMQVTDIPFNITLLELNKEKLLHLKPVTTTDISSTSGQRLGAVDNLEKADLSWQGDNSLTAAFHPDGLFSIPIFGRIGDDERDKRFSYIDIKVNIFHPLIYKNLIKLKGLYEKILTSKQYAIWDDEEKDFIVSNEVDGQTGFAFFMKHWKDIQFKETGSRGRSQRLELIEKYKDQALVNKILVLPAGLRDVRIGVGGRLEFDVINEPYRRIVGVSRTITESTAKANSPVMDYSRYQLQRSFNQIYDIIEVMLKDKKGFVQNKWSSRRIFNGTRNVITAMDTSKALLGEKHSFKATDTVVGLYQLMKGILPVTLHLLKNGYLGEVFGIDQDVLNVPLVNTKTLKREMVDLPSITRDRWTTIDGLQKIINSYESSSNRWKPVMIEGYYLGLIYKGPDNTFKIFGDIDEVPEGRNKEDVYPLSLIELLYLSGYRKWNNAKVVITRYPITELGSSYPSNVYVKTSIKGEARYELGDDWEIKGEDYVASEFPTKDPEVFLNSLVLSSVRLAGLGGDFDGDVCSANFIYSEEAKEEINRVLHSRETYVNAAGNLRTSANIDVLNLVVRNMSGDF